MASFIDKQKQLVSDMAKQAIFDASLEIICETGFEDLKMQHIAEKAGIATGTLYNYFKNKNDLLLYINERLHENTLIMVEEISNEDIPADIKLKKIVDSLIDVCNRHNIVFHSVKQFGIKEHVSKEFHKKKYLKGVELISKIIDQGRACGIFRDVDPNITGSIFFLSLFGLLEVRDHIDPQAADDFYRSFDQFFEKYLKAVPGKI